MTRQHSRYDVQLWRRDGHGKIESTVVDTDMTRAMAFAAAKRRAGSGAVFSARREHHHETLQYDGPGGTYYIIPRIVQS